jgi:sRNA-binding carbon storage regulator CsrA
MSRLVLNRRIGETLIIADRIRLTILSIREVDGEKVIRFRIEADPLISISHQEDEFELRESELQETDDVVMLEKKEFFA